MIVPNNCSQLAIVLFTAGIVEIVVGLLHFVMPLFANHSPGLRSLSGSESNFATLSIFSVGLLLVAFGSLTILVSFKSQELKGLLLSFLTIKSLLWCARVGLEIMFPVTIPLFYIQRPTTVVMPLLILVALLFIIPMVSIWRQRKTWKGSTS